MHRRFDIAKILLYVSIAVLVLIMLYIGMRMLETYFQNAEEAAPSASKVLVRDGVEYYPRQDITVFLLIGVDEFGPVQDSGTHENPGAADAVMLVVFDETAKTVKLLSINRDTMLQMPMLGIGGKPAGTYYGQLALSHTFGTGLEDSCENTKRAVSSLLYDLRIDHYVSMNMDAIRLLNDAVGGVQVTVTDDFSKTDLAIPMGDVCLTGEQALHYIRARQDLGDQLNVSRMQRQSQYAEQFGLALREKVNDSDQFVFDAYGQVEQYLVTDCSAVVLNSVVSHFRDYTFEETLTLEGENRKGEKYMEFYVDEEALDKTIIELFYAKK